MDPSLDIDELRAEYVNEVSDLLDKLSDALLAFERSPEDLSLVNPILTTPIKA